MMHHSTMAPTWRRTLHFIALLGLCAAYLQGGLNKSLGFNDAVAEMVHFGLAPAPLFAVAVIALELLGSAMILLGIGRAWAALALAGFTMIANLLALRFWQLPPGPERFAAANGFFEHLGLVGGFLLVVFCESDRKQV